MRHPERSASSASLTPSTPTKPFSVGTPPRRATRNSLSQRLSRLVSTVASFAGRAFRAALPGVAITVEGSKLLAEDANAGTGIQCSAKFGSRKVHVQSASFRRNYGNRSSPPKPAAFRRPIFCGHGGGDPRLGLCGIRKELFSRRGVQRSAAQHARPHPRRRLYPVDSFASYTNLAGLRWPRGCASPPGPAWIRLGMCDGGPRLAGGHRFTGQALSAR